MNIKDFKSLYIGGDKVKSIYIGGSLVWTSEEPIPVVKFLQLGNITITGTVIQPVYANVTSNIKLLSIENATITT